MNLNQFIILPPRQEAGEIMMVHKSLCDFFIGGPAEMHLTAD